MVIIPTREDKELIEPLVDQYFNRVPIEDYDREWLLEQLVSGRTAHKLPVLGINEQGDIVGFLLLLFGMSSVSTPTAFVQAIYVHMGHINRTIGEEMLDKVAAIAKSRGITHLSGVVPDDKKLKAWFRKYGFGRVGILVRKAIA
ncbi:MAG: N-acetyltransferase family protein [Candidatus Thorarchaeota archaeon]|jgi:ribosomal protein S18 acetylase RimI-like enzyme